MQQLSLCQEELKIKIEGAGKTVGLSAQGDDKTNSQWQKRTFRSGNNSRERPRWRPQQSSTEATCFSEGQNTRIHLDDVVKRFGFRSGNVHTRSHPTNQPTNQSSVRLVHIGALRSTQSQFMIVA